MSSKLGFSEWPFRTIPDEDFVRIWCGRVELRNKLDRIFQTILLRPMFQIYLVYGDYGAGKTHSIKHMLTKYSEEAKLLTSELEYDVTIRTFTQLYHALMSRLDFETLAEWPNLPTKGSWQDFDSFVNGLKSEDQEDRATAFRWLTGEEQSKRALSKIGIRSPIRNVDTAIRAFSQLTRLSGKNSSAVTLFIDEFQHIDKLNANWRGNILNGLTKMVNSSPRHLCLIISFRLRMPMKILSTIPNSMVSRFPGDPFIAVGNFSKEEGEEFMKCIFKKFLIHEAENSYFPFTPEAFKATLEALEERHVNYNPRSLMKIFGHLYERFEESNHNPPISEDFVKASLWSYRA